MVIDHIGIVVKSIDKGIELWERFFGYQQMTEPVVNTRQKVKVVFLKKENSLDIKLVEPTDSSSPVFIFAKKGGGLHHICFQCTELQSELVKLQGLGARILVQPEPGEAFAGREIAFVFVGQGLDIEVIDTDERLGII